MWSLRRARLIPGVVMLMASGAWADIPAGIVSISSSPVVRLDAEALARLKATNPNHYARAQNIIAAANELCRPVPEKVQYARFDAQDISCEGNLLLTSNPPQHQISFRLDDTRYMALVVVTAEPPRLVGAEFQK
jgi:hypothetical protein